MVLRWYFLVRGCNAGAVFIIHLSRPFLPRAFLKVFPDCRNYNKRHMRLPLTPSMPPWVFRECMHYQIPCIPRGELSLSILHRIDRLWDPRFSGLVPKTCIPHRIWNRHHVFECRNDQLNPIPATQKIHAVQKPSRLHSDRVRFHLQGRSWRIDFSTVTRFSVNWYSSIQIDCRISSGSNPVITMGFP